MFNAQHASVTLDNLFDQMQQGDMKDTENHRQGRRAGFCGSGSAVSRKAFE